MSDALMIPRRKCLKSIGRCCPTGHTFADLLYKDGQSHCWHDVGQPNAIDPRKYKCCKCRKRIKDLCFEPNSLFEQWVKRPIKHKGRK